MCQYVSYHNSAAFESLVGFSIGTVRFDILVIQISTTRPPFRVGYRRRSTTTRTPQSTVTSENIHVSRIRPSSLTANITISSPTKLSRRRVRPSRTTSKPVESQAATTKAPNTVTSRFRFVSRKPYLRTTTQKQITRVSTDQTIESTNHQSSDEISMNNNDTNQLADIAFALQKVQQAPIPQAKPSRKRPQIFRIPAQSTTRYTTAKTTTSTSKDIRESYSNPYSGKAQRNPSKNTIAIDVPFLRGNYVNSQALTADRFVSENIVTAAPLVREVYSSPQSITADEYVSKYTNTGVTSTRARVRYSTTAAPYVVITPGRPINTKSRGPPQAFQRVIAPVNANTYSSIGDYDYYDNVEASILGRIPEHSKVLLHSNGLIECLDQGNFPHPVSCKKFIYCAKMDNDKILGWEYTCPKNLSFDPIGGMCNWSAGLGCNES